MNPLVQLREFGQSPWYDYVRRGELYGLVITLPSFASPPR